MSDNPFIAILPTPLKDGDEITIKAKIADDADKFSMSFALSPNPDEDRIAYNFLTLFDTQTVEHNTRDGCWEDAVIEENTWVREPGEEFVLTFHFYDDNHVAVYTGSEEREVQYHYRHGFQVNDIQAVHISNVHWVSEITFRYARPF